MVKEAELFLTEQPLKTKKPGLSPSRLFCFCSITSVPLPGWANQYFVDIHMRWLADGKHH